MSNVMINAETLSSICTELKKILSIEQKSKPSVILSQYQNAVMADQDFIRYMQGTVDYFTLPKYVKIETSDDEANIKNKLNALDIKNMRLNCEIAKQFGNDFLSGCTSLESLEIFNNSASDFVFRAIRPFYGCTNLKALSFNNVYINSSNHEAFCVNEQSEPLPLEKVSTNSLSNWCKNSFNDTNYSTYCTPIRCSKNLYINDVLLENCIIPDDVLSIGKRSFGYCESILSLVVPGNVETIEDFAFADCVNLETINIEHGVKTLRDCCFYNCKNLNELSLPNTITTIKGSTFTGCSKITKITLENDFNADGLSFDSWNNIDLDVENILSILNALKDRTGLTSYTLSLGATCLSKLTNEQKAIATNKNWVLA